MARKILLADDSVTAQNMGRKILVDAGYDVVAVNNGSAALKKINETKPDLVVLDIYMPGYSGLEVCQRLKESPETARIPVLLTVGKLEPFKPEEARRVRAEGYIVKPFEASELLSALAKLEDKVVPRSEGSKPGRFARAIAAGEGSGRAEGEDSGWKNRISFPHRKTEEETKQEEKFTDDPSTYNQLNRDLRTVVEAPAAKTASRSVSKSEEQSKSASTETVDVGALASPAVPASLPADVTKEEIAAITAAAAQIKAATAAVEHDRAEFEAPAAISHTSGFEPPIREIDLSLPQANIPSTSERSSPEEPRQPAIIEATADISNAVTAIEDHRIGGSESTPDIVGEPVTMAATPESVSGSSRWSAVAVALDADEASLSLEHEMQKASPAPSDVSVATMATGSSLDTSTSSETGTSDALGDTESASSSLQTTDTSPERDKSSGKEDGVFASISGEPEAAQTDGEVPSGILASVADSKPVSFDAPPPAALSEPHSASALEQQTESSNSHSMPQEAATASSTNEQAASYDGDQQPTTEGAASSPEASKNTFTSFVPGPEPAHDSSNHLEGQEAVAQRAENEQPESMQLASIQLEPPPQPEAALDSESVKSTAAAWASWRHIRDNKVELTPRETAAEKPESAALTEAAKAVAAGAEASSQTSDTTPSESSGDVASIVDSVLADLRPKLMAEISRKMAEKK